jgi:stage II sporulation protein GA (sporulation sigma-E factor processing peptidase)
MEIIYVDRVFLLNLIIDYLLLVVTCRLGGGPIRRGRCLLGAVLGGIYAVACFLPGYGFLSTAAFKLALWGLMSLAAFGGEAHLARYAVCFLVVSAVFGGGVWAASMLAGGAGPFGSAVALDLPTLGFSFAVGYALLTLALRHRMRAQPREIVPARLTLRDKTVELRCLRDTGNGLRENLSGRRVLVLDVGAAAPLFTPAEAEALRCTDGAAALIRLGQIPGAPHFRPVVYSAVGTSAALLPAFLPRELYIDGLPCRDYAAAISPTPIGDGSFNSIC